MIVSPETGLHYRIARLLGEGGFGQAYLALRLGRSKTVPQHVCIKVSPRMDGWLREAYFGQVLDGHERAIRVYDCFPLMRADGRVLYYLALEYAEHGDLSAFLRRASKGWSEPIVRREIAGLLDVLRKLHRGQTLHRDLTPVNVFVCAGPRLKLGDFGIVRQQSDTRGITAFRTFAVERIRGLSLQEERFTPVDLPEETFAHSLGVNEGPPERMEISFDRQIAPYVRERRWHPSQQIVEAPDGGIVVRLDVTNDWALRSWILSFGPLAKVLSPASLSNQIKDETARAAARYGLE